MVKIMTPTIRVKKSFFDDLIECVPEKALTEIIIKNAEQALENPDAKEPGDLSFEYQGGNHEELLYGTSFVFLLEGLYKKYQFEPVAYILENVDKDIQNLWNSWINGLKALTTVFDNKASKNLVDKGIQPNNLGKIDFSEKTPLGTPRKKPTLSRIKLADDLKPEAITESILNDTKKSISLAADTIRDGLNEQISTLSSIASQLKHGLKSKAYYLKNRKTEQLFNPNTNFKTAFNRLKTTVESGFVSTQNHAVRKAAIFLFGDPEVGLVTKGDSRVCKWCLAIEAQGFMKLSEMPFVPIHNHCRCVIKTRAEIEGQSMEEQMMQLTQEAMALTYYSNI
jgi:hypothetical protein